MPRSPSFSVFSTSTRMWLLPILLALGCGPLCALAQPQEEVVSWVVFCDPEVQAVGFPRDGLPPTSVELLRNFFLTQIEGIGERNLEVSGREASPSAGCFVEYVVNAFVRGSLTSAQIEMALEGGTSNDLATSFAEPLGIKDVTVSVGLTPSPSLPPASPAPPSFPPPVEKKVTFTVKCIEDDRRRLREHYEPETISVPGLQEFVFKEMPEDISSRDVIVTREPKSEGEDLDPCFDYVYLVEIFTGRSPSTLPQELSEHVLDLVKGDHFKNDLDDAFFDEQKVRNVDRELSRVPSPYSPPGPPPFPPAPPATPPPLEDVLAFFISCVVMNGSGRRRRLSTLSTSGVTNYVDEQLGGSVSSRDIQTTRVAPGGGKGRRLSEDEGDDEDEDPCDFDYQVEVFPTRSGANTAEIFAILDGEEFRTNTMTAFDGVQTQSSDVVQFQALVPAPFSPPPSPPSPPPVPPGSVVLNRVVVKATFGCAEPAECRVNLTAAVGAYHETQLGPGLFPPTVSCPTGVPGIAYIVTVLQPDSPIDPASLLFVDKKPDLAEVVEGVIGCPVNLEATPSETVKPRLFCSLLETGQAEDLQRREPGRWCAIHSEDREACEMSAVSSYTGPVATKFNRCRFRENEDESTSCFLSGPDNMVSVDALDDEFWCSNPRPAFCTELENSLVDLRKLDPPEWCNFPAGERREDPEKCEATYVTTFVGVSRALEPYEKRQQCQYDSARRRCTIGFPWEDFTTNCLI